MAGVPCLGLRRVSSSEGPASNSGKSPLGVVWPWGSAFRGMVSGLWAVGGRALEARRGPQVTPCRATHVGTGVCLRSITGEKAG